MNPNLNLKLKTTKKKKTKANKTPPQNTKKIQIRAKNQ